MGTISPEVDAYIAAAPAGVRSQLRRLRSIIRATLPDSVELVSYRMPGYSYPGYGYNGMVVWFGLQRRHIGLYLRPPTIANHRRALVAYGTTKSAVHLPMQGPIPAGLVRRLVRASARVVRGPATRALRERPGRSRKRR